jgi:prophage DNA circulation protein
MLIEVLVLEAKIQDNVTPINNSVASIRTHTDNIKALNTVDSVAKDIRAAADPLSGQAATILTTVGAIQATVAEIDGATGSILSHAGAIDTTVVSITPHVRLIAEPAEGIKAGLTTTTARLASVVNLLTPATADLDYIAGNVVPRILASAASIDGKLP